MDATGLMESAAQLAWLALLASMVLSVPVGLLARRVRMARMEREARRGLRELLDPPGLRVPEYRGPRVCPDRPGYRVRPDRRARKEMWE